jgi:hypothetical protein
MEQRRQTLAWYDRRPSNVPDCLNRYQSCGVLMWLDIAPGMTALPTNHAHSPSAVPLTTVPAASQRPDTVT